jgi:hypothetical protein
MAYPSTRATSALGLRLCAVKDELGNVRLGIILARIHRSHMAGSRHPGARRTRTQQRKEAEMNTRAENYDALLSRESESRERIAKALYEIELQKGNGIYNPTAIKRLLVGN